MWADPRLPQGNFCVLILSQSLSSSSTGSMSQIAPWRRKKNIFRIILEKGDTSEPLLEPRYPNMRKEGRREYDGFFLFHLQFTLDKSVRKKAQVMGLWLPWQLFYCVQPLTASLIPYRSTYKVSRGHDMLIPGSRGGKAGLSAWHITNISLKLISFLRIIVVIFNLE